MRKLVTPADPKASIPDPDRGGFLPADGRVVSWTPYWAGLAARQDITAAEVAPDPVEPAPGGDAGEPDAEAHEGAPSA